MKADILLVTVNDHEDNELREALRQNGFDGKNCQSENSLYHYMDFGSINGQSVVLAKSRMGSSTGGASYDTVRYAIRDYMPSMVLCVGIAWGGEETKQKIGDLLISSQIQIGANAKIAEKKITFRAERPAASITGARTLEEAAKQMGVTYYLGTILSKEDLFDNQKARNAALEGSGAIGGEMEATGALQALARAREEYDQNFEIVVAKSICDWGYKKNVDEEQKEEYQKQAASNAAKVVVHALQHYKFIKKKSQHQQAAGDKEDTQGQNEVDIKTTLNCVEEFDFQLLYSKDEQAIPRGSIVYWPVRLRRPNVVHAAQAYVAAHLQEKGLDVRLCLDDLGNPEGYASIQSGVTDFKTRVEAWVRKASNSTCGEAISENTILFSDFVKSPDQETDDTVFARLGKNLVTWLLESERLKNVLQDSKLLDQDSSPQLDRKPRKLLSPSVVWTVMECVVKNLSDGQALATLGGHDEYAIWQACPQKNSYSIQSIFLPKVRGDMDTQALRPGTQQELAENLTRYPEMREWVQNYLIKFPAKVMEQDAIAYKDWTASTDREVANAVFEYYR
ncbi:5'-methylthioadenosine/S-adenosylhomocysteine nucleosidase [Thalassovita gelatinovora]|uniref:5'-methylthioadenosine/S-adenosylhomocysteine nucleosidase n=1 Tax=Thalassovita gelatinovora TaxID=53501 RepID=A0A0P1FMG3_THAGE|nr:hypothetical protein [Thalassovita gelatinovora]QIZ79089.1 5'-methylthioadenosine/S-adenosylhomocysteine nucleosidase [Thalassovita gelatinovora]CUH68726.1 5'-methylthioadenosine/S-adenosylhomocysteine nucleosidase [Thalassovita gelatinovora]SEQ57388.1 Nucleoside phosphorylase [Thalassovita gelatinovora]